MLDAALTFLANELNAYLLARTGSAFGDARVSRLVDDTGKWAVVEDHIGLALVNVEEERVLKTQVPEPTYVEGRQVLHAPELKLNLHVVFAAHFRQYDQALRYLSHVLTFLQARPQFTPDEYPGLRPDIERLALELLSLGYEQLNQLWAFVGAKQLPAVVYRVRMVVLQDAEPSSVGLPITTIDTLLTHR